jgi:hypothetical protein
MIRKSKNKILGLAIKLNRSLAAHMEYLGFKEHY